MAMEKVPVEFLAQNTVDEKITVNIIFQMICLRFALIRIFAHVLYRVNSFARTLSLSLPFPLYGRN